LVNNITNALGSSELSVASFLDAGKSTLANVLQQGATDRSTALDLLTADALVTYAFEMVADDPESTARDAMHSIAQLAT
jgi:hypothetical protein